jgi:cell division septation protein DedD/nucleoid DNA-binding protein
MIKHIIELINKNNKLIIPDLGAFLSKENPDNGKKDIFFNDVLKYNDGTLVNHISSKEEISTDEALRKVADFVEAVKNGFLQGQDFTLDGFGILKKDTKGYINFVAQENATIPTEVHLAENDVFELAETPIVPITQEAINNQQVVDSNDSINDILEFENEKIIEDISMPNPPLSEPTSQVIEQVLENEPERNKLEERVDDELNIDKNLVEYSSPIQTPVEMTENDKIEAEEKKIRKELTKVKKNDSSKNKFSTKYIILGIVGLVLIGAGIVSFMYLEQIKEQYSKILHQFNGKEITEEVSKIESESADSTIASTSEKPSESIESVPKEVKSENADLSVKKETSETKADQPKPVETKSEVVSSTNENSGKSFHVVIGSFPSKENADSYCNKMRSNGFPEARVLQSASGSSFRIVASSFSSQSDAQSETARLMGNGTQAWVLKQ